MKKSFILILLYSSLSITLFAQESFRININNINLPLDNKGVLAQVNIPPGGEGGLYNDIYFLFSGGFYLSGYEGDSLWANGVATAGSVKDYRPGIVGSDPSATENIIYVVKADDPPFGQSWQNWSYAVSLGADFYDGNSDGIYNPVDLNNNGIWDLNEDKPDIIGDITAWCVYNDGVPATQRRWQSEPKGIEMHQTVFAYKDNHPQFSNTQNTIFIRYRIINKGTVAQKLDSVYFGFYDDYDLGDASDDLSGCDTILKGSYVYNNGEDQLFGSNPPAAFTHFNQFPHVFIPGETFIDNNSNGIYDEGIDTPIDTAYSYRGSQLGIRNIPGAKNIDFSSSVVIRKAFPGYSDAQTKIQARNYMLGRTLNGPLPNPCNLSGTGVFGGVNCAEINPVYWLSGDPVSNIGWIGTYSQDIRIIGSAGPFDLSNNDQYDIILAYTLGQGTDPINSINVARQNVINARNAYLSNFGQFPVSVDENEFVVNNYKLFQNYPNPFNPSTSIRYQIPEAGLVTLRVCDLLGREVATLVDEFRNAGSYEVEFDAGNLASGVYIYQLRVSDFITSNKMIILR